MYQQTSHLINNQHTSSFNFRSTPPQILVADDHAASRMSAVALLTLEGYEVTQTDCGEAALAQAVQSLPDVILLDVIMPGMNGFEVCRKLKTEQQTRKLPVIFITALSDRRSRIQAIEAGGDDFITKPFDRLELSARIKSLLRQRELSQELNPAEQALFSFARAIESRDPNTGDHCERLVARSQAFGEFLCLSRAQIRDLQWGGYLHDIGKVGIPDSVLLKKDKLTEREWETMRQHVTIGVTICQPLETIHGVIPIIRHHHERWDGSGYPDKLVGDQIPFLAQVFQLIDIYDALTSERPYKAALTSEQALLVMLEETDKGWRNPQLMQQFVEFIRSSNLKFE